MKNRFMFRRFCWLALLTVFVVFSTVAMISALADELKLPAGLKRINEQASSGNHECSGEGWNV